MDKKLIVNFQDIDIHQVTQVGGKNASLGEMYNKLSSKGINIPDGFALTSSAFKFFLDENKLTPKLKTLLDSFQETDLKELQAISKKAKDFILNAKLPDPLIEELKLNLQRLINKYGQDIYVAVRSSASAEDLPNASFAGLHDSFLYVKGIDSITAKIVSCYASVFNVRALKYRMDNQIKHTDISISVGVQLMVAADTSSSGVLFTIEPDSGFRNVIVINSCWGLGENIVQGALIPDEFHVFKPMLLQAKRPIIQKKIGSKQKTLIFDQSNKVLVNTDTDPSKQLALSLNDSDVIQLAKWAIIIEKHYGYPMDIEWAKDGVTQKLFVVQARPETIFSRKHLNAISIYQLKERGFKLASGSAVGYGIRSGIARILNSPSDAEKLNVGEILITENTSPDWDPIMKKAAAIITEKGGRTSHAAIVARELNAIAIVGVTDVKNIIKDGEWITVDNSVGKNGLIYKGKLDWTEQKINLNEMKMPKTKPMLILSDPDNAYKFSFYPNSGVGLLRIEFVISGSIGIHPMALVNYDSLSEESVKIKIEKLTSDYADKREYFIEQLSQAVGTIAAAFYPKQVIVRMSDFKSNEYANLLGGSMFEIQEANPMIGFRGASRYYDVRYMKGFELECKAMRRVREEMGFRNLKLMIPFCRTVEEGEKVLAAMEKYGLKKGENGLEIYMMVEIPSNVILAEEFATIFDGFSIGSNDLTQLVLGIDRDSSEISHLFDENNQAVKSMIGQVIRTANRCRVPIGLCGQAPSDDPEFATFLIRQGVNSISVNPDALLKGIENMMKAEELTF